MAGGVSAKEFARWSPKDRAKWKKQWKLTTDGKGMTAMGLAMFQYKLTSGLASRWSRLQSRWTPLDPKYRRRKIREGLLPEIWERTGATLAAVTANAPTRIGTKRQVRFGINFYSDAAFIRPTTIFNRGEGRPKVSGSKAQRAVWSRLNFGPASTRLAEWKAKQKAAGRPVDKFFRNWLRWEREDIPPITADVERAMATLMKEQGFEARAAR